MTAPKMPEPDTAHMTNNTELIARLLEESTELWEESQSISYLLHEAADAILAMERKPMTQEKAEELAHRRATTYTHRSAPGYSSYAFVPHTLMDFVRAIEAHHGIQPNVKGE